MRLESRAAVRNGKIVRLKSCRTCGLEGICTDDSDTDFRVARRDADRRPLVWEAHCILCYRKRSRERARRRRLTPEGAASLRAASARWAAKKRLEDPTYFRDAGRMQHRLRAARAGRTVRKSNRPIFLGEPRLPTGPFVAWAEEYMKRRAFSDVSTLALDLDIEERRLRSCLAGEQEFVAVDTVDRALMNASLEVTMEDGRVIFSLDDLYPGEHLGRAA